MAEHPRTPSPAPDPANAAAADPGGIEDLDALGRHEGIGHRAAKPPSDREHGKKTRQRNKDIISGRA